MRKMLLGFLLLATLVIPVSTATTQADLPPVLPVENPDTLQNDFVNWDWTAFLGDWFVPATVDQFEDPYRFDNIWDVNTGHAYWVTTDAVLHALHVAFTDLLNFLETDELYAHVRNVALQGYEAAFAQYEAAQGTTLEEPARAAALYYAVALGLMDAEAYTETVDAALQADADSLLDAANSAEGRLEVPFLPRYQEDFSQYKPRGNYTTSELLQRYFRGMMWLGRITFLARDDASLQASLLALRALEQSGAAADWAAVSETLTYLVGPTDNLGPAEYLPLAQAIYGNEVKLDALADMERLAEFRAEVNALPGPRINNVVRPIGTEAEDLDESTRGFRLFGQRFTFDGYAMQRLIYPYVGEVGTERILPAGLDVATVLGSDTAYDLLVQQGETDYTNYDTNMIELREQANQISGADWLQNVYGGWLMALQPLWNRSEEPYPALMNTDAWRMRDLYTGLGSWAELKHATVLYAAQPMGGLGGGGEFVADTTNYIEPNPLVFSRIAVVAASVVQGLDDREIGVDDPASGELPSGSALVRDAFFQLGVVSARLADMANKHLWGIPLNDDEQIFLKYHFGSELWYVRYMAELALADPPQMAAIVTDVASNPDAGRALQVGTGYVNYIYVITDSPQGLQITRGAVYSYYEFVNDIDKRLTDETWRGMVQAGNLPPRPAWTSSFFSD
jgi:hypothetical protein